MAMDVYMLTRTLDAIFRDSCMMKMVVDLKIELKENIVESSN